MPRLSSIADIRMGATLRGRDATRPDPKGAYQFVRIGDISQDGTLRSEDFLRIEPNEPVREELWLRPGDVLFPNRGTRTTALAFPLDQPRIIVGPQFFIVRPDDERVSAEYLAWFLRSAEAAAHFEARRKGTYVQIIQRGDLAERTFRFEIPKAMQLRDALIEKLLSIFAFGCYWKRNVAHSRQQHGALTRTLVKNFAVKRMAR